LEVLATQSFHSISFPSEWGRYTQERGKDHEYRFHSISFPSEWGQLRGVFGGLVVGVSIQLVSPASGDPIVVSPDILLHQVSIQLVSPASGDPKLDIRFRLEDEVSIQLVSPASGDWDLETLEGRMKAFPFN